MPKRPPWRPEIVRRRIQSTKIVQRLQLFVDGEVKMTAPQVTAALGLLRKTVPDLSAIEHTGEVATPQTRGEIDERIAKLIARVSERIDGRGSESVVEAPGSSETAH